MKRVWRKVLALALCLLLMGAGGMFYFFSKAKSAFQSDADIIRLNHLVTLGELVEKCKSVAKVYPFEDSRMIPKYVFIGTKEQG